MISSNDTVLLRYVSAVGAIKLPTITRRLDPTAGYVERGYRRHAAPDSAAASCTHLATSSTRWNWLQPVSTERSCVFVMAQRLLSVRAKRAVKAARRHDGLTKRLPRGLAHFGLVLGLVHGQVVFVHVLPGQIEKLMLVLPAE